ASCVRHASRNASREQCTKPCALRRSTCVTFSPSASSTRWPSSASGTVRVKYIIAFLYTAAPLRTIAGIGRPGGRSSLASHVACSIGNIRWLHIGRRAGSMTVYDVLRRSEGLHLTTERSDTGG